MRDVSDEVTEKIKTRFFLFNNLLFENRAVYEKMWKCIVPPGRPQMAMQRMPFGYRVTKATNIHSGKKYLFFLYSNSCYVNAACHYFLKCVYSSVDPVAQSV